MSYRNFIRTGNRFNREDTRAFPVDGISEGGGTWPMSNTTPAIPAEHIFGETAV